MTRNLALAALIAILGPGQALAHARLIHAVPKVGSTVKVPPSELELFFSERIDPRDSTVTLVGPAGRIPTGPTGTDPADARRVRVPVPGHLSPGAYRVRWGMTSEDTHHTEGDFSFRIEP